MESIVSLFKKKFPGPTKVQGKAMPRLLQGGNAVVIAPTGSGKTEAALLPVLEKIQGKGGIAALYITPLRALNRDMEKRVKWWCENAGISFGVRHGDTKQAERGRQRRNPPQLLILTPETLQAVLVGRVMREHLANVRHVIVDELHEMLESKRGSQLSMALERLAEIAGEFQRVGLSATVGSPEEAGKTLCGKREFEIIEAGTRREMDIEVLKYAGGWGKAYSAVGGMLGDGKKRIIFVNTRSGAEELSTKLKMEKVQLDVHHGSLASDARLRTEREFKDGELDTVVATSSLELGIDIGGVEEIVQVSSPRAVSRLVQRVGRSGHCEGLVPRGKVITVDFDDWLEAEAVKGKFEGGFLEPREVPKGSLDVVAHQAVGVMIERGMCKVDDVYALLGRAHSFGIGKEKFLQVLKQLERERLIFLNDDGTVKARRDAREYYFYNLSTIPKERRYLLRDASTNRAIASLDERFVATLAEGECFSAKGRVWQLVEVGAEVIAEPAFSYSFVVPEWSGEDLPVDFEIAQEVGRLRRKRLKEGPVPDDRTVVVELAGDFIIVHACFGTKVNAVLGKVFRMELAKLLRVDVAEASDAYRVMLKLPFPAKREWAEKIISQKDFIWKAEEAIAGTPMMRMEFLHVGRLFGLFGEEAEVGSKLVRIMAGSPVYEEALNSIFRRRLDAGKAGELLGEIERGERELAFVHRERPGFLSMLGITRKGRGVPSMQPRDVLLKEVREEVSRKKTTLLCLSCGATRITTIGNAPEELKCHKCGRKSLTVKGKEERYAAGILQAYGKRGLLALGFYGVGPRTADRILRKLHRDEEAMLLELLDAQKDFIKNKKYWKA